MTYVDGFVLAVPNAQKEAYIEHAKACVPVFKKYGVTRMVECWGDDVPDGKLTSFAMAVAAKPDESIVFSWFEWPDKATRDKGVAGFRADPFFADDTMVMPFDGKRMIFGGFSVLLDE